MYIHDDHITYASEADEDLELTPGELRSFSNLVSDAVSEALGVLVLTTYCPKLKTFMITLVPGEGTAGYH